MGENEVLTVAAQDRIKELHVNIRHITHLGMSWFAFFVTTNYLTMGWLAREPRSGIIPKTFCNIKTLATTKMIPFGLIQKVLTIRKF
ncbi:MAG: hypothetical protein H7Z16_05605 [Pyrinomonadaceae bacterium]|nr:hypothetical protein [Pyrinomonadaceae bacterium]